VINQGKMRSDQLRELKTWSTRKGQLSIEIRVYVID
jgi:hypothetical protein